MFFSFSLVKLVAVQKNDDVCKVRAKSLNVSIFVYSLGQKMPLFIIFILRHVCKDVHVSVLDMRSACACIQIQPRHLSFHAIAKVYYVFGEKKIQICRNCSILSVTWLRFMCDFSFIRMGFIILSINTIFGDGYQLSQCKQHENVFQTNPKHIQATFDDAALNTAQREQHILCCFALFFSVFPLSHQVDCILTPSPMSFFFVVGYIFISFSSRTLCLFVS